MVYFLALAKGGSTVFEAARFDPSGTELVAAATIGLRAGTGRTRKSGCKLSLLDSMNIGGNDVWFEPIRRSSGKNPPCNRIGPTLARLWANMGQAALAFAAI